MNILEPKTLRIQIVRRYLQEINMWSSDAEEVVFRTGVHESGCGQWLTQVGGGPALGLYGCEPLTYFDILDNVIPAFYHKLKNIQFPRDPHILIYDARISTICCRLHYARRSEPLPKYNDVRGQAEYWEKYYNTTGNVPNENDFLKSMKEYL